MSYRINRRVGIELEVAESYHSEEMPPKPKYWNKKGDGSVYGIGAEFVFQKPLSGKDVVDAVSNICFWFKHRTESSPKPYKTIPRRSCWFRTEDVNNGFHLHLDYNGVSDEKALNLLDCSHLIYQNIIKTVAESRKRNSYCEEYDRLPSQEIPLLGNRRHFGRITRYKFINAVNLQYAHGKRTIEIRLHEGTGDKDKILTWTEFWVTLANLCDNGRVTRNFVLAGGFAGLLNRMNLSDKTRERFEKCV